MWRCFLIFSILLLQGLCTPFSHGQTTAVDKKPTGRYASIIVDADNLDVIHARQIDELRYPASLTKIMTLYLTFDALNQGQLRLDQKIKVSRVAARTAPTKLGLRAGQTVSVDTLIRAVAVRSANDAAVVLGEHLAGSEHAFADQMTAKARSLGMRQTVFKTANGLPHPEQLTTARDMAKLANAILSNHRRYYHYFGLKSFSYGGRTYKNTNGLLHSNENVDGFKTGFTNASGYNLIVSARRDGRRLIAVVLGGASGASRNSHMDDLIDRGFDVMGVAPQTLLVTERTPAKKIIKPVPKTPQFIELRGRKTPKTIKASTQTLRLPQKSWSVQVGLFSTKTEAQSHLESISILPEFNTARSIVINRGVKHAARMTALSAKSAREACKALEKSRHGCLIIGPGS